jgi:hypothetical protein
VVIVLTNYAYPQYRDRFLASGADYFFDKSAELDQMLQALDSLRYRFMHRQTHTTAQAHGHPNGQLHTMINHGGKHAH